MTHVEAHGGGSASIGETSDADLVLRTRSGDSGSFGELWRRHYRSGITVARSITSSLDADDLVQEAYARIYQAILKGGGPTGAFRAYLFTSIRNTAAAWGRARKETTIDVLEALEDPETTAAATEEALDRSLTVQAFRSLPTRWQEVLWYTEIEGMKPAEVAPLLGMKATAVAQLAFRAREGLREAWIQAHLRSVADGSPCQWTIERLGAYSRGNLGARDSAKLEAHLSECARCTIVAAEAREVSDRLALVLLPLTVGVAGTASYLAWLQGSGAPIAAMAAMPSGVVDGAVLAGSAAAGAGSSAAGSAAGGAASTTGGGASGVGAGIGIAAAAVVVAGAVAAALILPAMLGDPPVPRSSAVNPVEPGAADGSIVVEGEPTLPAAELVEPVEPPVTAPDPAPQVPGAGTVPEPVVKAPPPAPQPQPQPQPEPQPEPEPEPEPEPGLSPGAPEITASSARFAQGRWTFELTISAAPGSTVQARVRGEVRATAPADGAGTAALTFTASNGEVRSGEAVELRCWSEGETGEPLSQPLLTLVP
jgi:RNA polymerase sigma factor (sigma-70 family)